METNAEAVKIQAITIADLWQCLENVCDPEIPVLSVLDMGVVRNLKLTVNGKTLNSGVEVKENASFSFAPLNAQLQVDITPTYTGCPAMNMIAAHIRLELAQLGLPQTTVIEVLSPAWTTDWMSEAAKIKLKEYGIAPPQQQARRDKLLFEDVSVTCPHCNSSNTERIAEFGSTACKSLHRCLDCREPFDYFKCH